MVKLTTCNYDKLEKLEFCLVKNETILDSKKIYVQNIQVRCIIHIN